MESSVAGVGMTLRPPGSLGSYFPTYDDGDNLVDCSLDDKSTGTTEPAGEAVSITVSGMANASYCHPRRETGRQQSLVERRRNPSPCMNPLADVPGLGLD